MTTSRYNWQSDLIRHEVFCIRNSAGAIIQTSIPADNIDFSISYSTKGRGAFTASRTGGKYTNCAKIDESTLAVYIPLSETQIGRGRLVRKITLKIPAPAFPSGVLQIDVPTKTNLALYDGASDFDGPSVDQCIIPDLEKFGV